MFVALEIEVNGYVTESLRETKRDIRFIVPFLRACFFASKN